MIQRSTFAEEARVFFDSYGATELAHLLKKRSGQTNFKSFYEFLLFRSFWRERIMWDVYEHLYLGKTEPALGLEDGSRSATSQFVFNYNRTFAQSAPETQRRLKGMLRRGLTSSSLDSFIFELSCINYLQQIPGELALVDISGSDAYDLQFRTKIFRTSIELKSIDFSTGERVKLIDVARVASQVLPTVARSIANSDQDFAVLVSCKSSFSGSDKERDKIEHAAVQSALNDRPIETDFGIVETRFVSFGRQKPHSSYSASYLQGAADHDAVADMYRTQFGVDPLYAVAHPYEPSEKQNSALGIVSDKPDKREQRVSEALEEAADQLSGHRNGLIMIEAAGIPFDFFLDAKEMYRTTGQASYMSDAAAKLLAGRRGKSIIGIVYCSEYGFAPLRLDVGPTAFIQQPIVRETFTVPNVAHARYRKILRHLRLE